MQIAKAATVGEECPHGGRATPGGRPMRGSWAGRGRRSARPGAEAGPVRPVRPAIGPQLGRMHAFGPFPALERAKDMLWGQLWPSCCPHPAPKGASAGGCTQSAPRQGAWTHGKCTLSTALAHLWVSCRPDVAPGCPGRSAASPSSVRTPDAGSTPVRTVRRRGPAVAQACPLAPHRRPLRAWVSTPVVSRRRARMARRRPHPNPPPTGGGSSLSHRSQCLCG